MTESYSDLYHEESIALIRSLRTENARLRKQVNELELLKTSPALLWADNDRLRKENKRLRRNVSGKRKEYPAEVMPFGCHEGQPISEVPASYLRWVVGNVEEISEELQAVLVAELERRARGFDGPLAKPKRKESKRRTKLLREETGAT